MNYEKNEEDIPEKQKEFIQQTVDSYKKSHPTISIVSEPAAEYVTKDVYIDSLLRALDSKDRTIALLEEKIELLKNRSTTDSM